MKQPAVTAVLISMLGILGCSPQPAPSPESSDSSPSIAARFEVVENRPEGGFQSRLTLHNRTSRTLESDGWTLYFNFGRRLVGDPGSGVHIEHRNGDFFQLVPTAEFVPLEPGDRRDLLLEGDGWLLKESDAPAGLYVVFEDDGEIVAIRNLEMAPWPRWTGGGEEIPAPAPTAASRFHDARWAAHEADDSEILPLLPSPVFFQRGDGGISVDDSWRIAASEGLAGEAEHLSRSLAPHVGSNLPIVADGESDARTIRLTLGPLEVGGEIRETGAEAYRLTADRETGVEILGSDPAGAFYGVQSLLGLLPLAEDSSAGAELPAVLVEDAPRFSYRGLHLDVARNFQSVETVQRLLDLMAFYKLNRFHLHLTDDEGWRLAIDKLPELTSVGSRRGHTLDDARHLVPSFGSGPDPDAPDNHGSGHYTEAEFVEILRFAAARHIEVVPEIDVPGHARAAIQAMEARGRRLLAEGREEEAATFRLQHPEDRSEYRSIQGWDDNVIDVCLPSTYHFLETVVDSLVARYREAEAPLTAIHVGGDEVPAGVWAGSPACQALLAESDELDEAEELMGYFLDRMISILADRGLVTAGWEEIALHEERSDSGVGKRPNPELADRGLRPYVWNSVWGWGGEDLAYRLANAGYEVVLANATNLYFDLAYDRDPREPGYVWAGAVDTRTAFEFDPLDFFASAREDRLGHPIDAVARFPDRVLPNETGRRNLIGIQGQLWAENAKGRDALEHAALPKALALAERAWAAEPPWARAGEPDERERQLAAAWSRFARTLGERELPRLDLRSGGFTYRLPPPGAVLEEGRLLAATPFPGLEIRYTTDGTEPTAEATLFQGPVAVEPPVRLRSFDRRGRGSLTTLLE